ncbi:hydroxyethylthiazole kinase [Photobacterium damselae]|uniref:hydroxyethylthiazole kinase n=1 Tax=Photobacterium damselae TaxID=38293 RepID=UPI0035A8D711
MEQHDYHSLIIQSLATLKQQKPLVVNLTNYVVMNNTANALLAIGASPIMAHSRDELAELMAISGALVINIGTLDSHWIPRMHFAIEQANRYNKPVVIDPVGCGASQLRTQTAQDLVALANNATIRGNASEIIALAGHMSNSKGVDAQDSTTQACSAAKQLAQQYQCSVVISGETDYIVDAGTTVTITNGHAMMPHVTGMGCTHTALTGAFTAIGETTGVTATALLGIAGEIAAENSAGPGSLQINLLDTLYQLDSEIIEHRLRLSVIV